MKFDDLDKKLRIYETYQDRQVLPGMYMVARIDGRNFTKLTKEKHDFQAPFDEKFRDMMVATVKHLMCCGYMDLLKAMKSHYYSTCMTTHLDGKPEN